MLDTQKEDLVAQLKRAFKAKKPYYFWFCPKGPDGEPVLLVEKKEAILKKQARLARKEAQIKMFAAGTVQRGPDGLLFVNHNDKLPGAKVERLFRTKLAPDEGLKKIAGRLRKASVLTPQEFESVELPELEEDSVDEVDRDDLESLYKQKMGQAKELVNEARDVMGADNPGFKVLRAARKPIVEARKAGDLSEAIRLLDELLENGQHTLRASIEQDWDEKVLKARDLYQKVREQIGENGEGFAALSELRKSAAAARKSGNIPLGIERLDALMVRCHEILDGAEPVDPEAQQDSAEDLEGADEFDIGIEDAERRWDALDNPDDLLPFFDAVARAVTNSRYTEAQRVLDTEILWRLDKHERNQEAAAEIGKGGVEFAKLAIAWRDAQKAAAGEMQRFKSAVLGDDEIQADPRFDEIARKINQLDAMIPDFGTQLADALEDLTNLPRADRADAAKAARKVLAGYQRQLESSAGLQSIDESAFGKFQVFGHLRDTLGSLDSHLQGAEGRA